MSDSDSDVPDYTELVNMPIWAGIMMFNGYGYDVCSAIYKNEGFWTIFNYPDDFKFDLMIYDYTSAPCFLGLLPKFKYPPLVGVTAFCNPSSTADILGGDKLGLTVKPHYLLDYDVDDMNVFQRIFNGFVNMFESAFRKYYGVRTYDKQMREIFGNDMPYAGDLEKLMQVAFINTHPAIEFAESLPPNVIEIGGLQIKEPQPLDEQLEKFLLEGKKGSVLMSLGSNFRSDTLGEEKIMAIVEAFSQLSDYNFIWKFETAEKLKDLPPNVMIKPWLSQNDILGHKNVKAFISHAGMLSTLESTWQGVPIVGIPLFADQIRNLKKSIKAGVAVKVGFNEITTANLKSALLEVLESSKYKSNMEVRSKLFKDQPEKPLDRAVWWCEYVIRNPKATHMKAPVWSFGFFGSHFWDMQIIVVVLLLTSYCALKKPFKRLFKKSAKNVDRSKKSN
jgi:glucuronosyltransferase